MAELVEISKKLRQVRSEKGLTLDEIAQQTKISIIILRKIESCDFHSISNVYLRAYLQQYAIFLECENLLPSIDEVLPPKTAPIQKDINTRNSLFKNVPKLDASPTIHISKSHNNTNHKPFLSAKNIFFIICIILIPVLLVRGCNNISKIIKNQIKLKQENKQTTVKRHINKNKTKKKKPIKLPDEAPTKPKKPQTVTPVIDPIKAELAQSTKKLPSMKIMTKANVFVRVKADGELIFKSIVSKGSQETWTATNKLEVMLSKPSEVLLEIFDKRTPTKNFNKPVTYIITPKGFTTKK